MQADVFESKATKTVGNWGDTSSLELLYGYILHILIFIQSGSFPAAADVSLLSQCKLCFVSF